MTDALRDLSEPEHLSIHDPILRHSFGVESDEGANSELWDLLQRPEWHQFAACRGKDVKLWFPDEGDGKSRSEGLRICHTCPVMYECREAGNENHEWGTWGGLSQWSRSRKNPRRGNRRIEAKCGTRAGYHAHRRNGEEACEACRAAAAAHSKERRGATGDGDARVALSEQGWCWDCAAGRHGCLVRYCACPRCREEGAA